MNWVQTSAWMANDAYETTHGFLRMSWYRLTIIHAGKSEEYPEGSVSLGLMGTDLGMGAFWDRTIGTVEKELSIEEAQQWAIDLIQKDEECTSEEKEERVKEDQELREEFRIMMSGEDE